LAAMLAGWKHEVFDTVGVCVPGPVEGTVVVEASNLPAVVNLDVRAWLDDAFGFEGASLCTDTLAGALGAHALEPRAGRAVYLSLGTGVGGAVLDDGQPLNVTRGTPGHLGHMDVSGGERDAPIAPGAGRGALQAYIGDAALREAGVPVDEADCFSHPAAGGALAALARAVRIVLVLYRPQHVIFTGGLGVKLRAVLPRLNTMIRDELSVAAPRDFALHVSQGDGFTAARGAILHARHCQMDQVSG